MSLTFGLLMLVTGLAIMAFGLFLFYAWLPLLYALIGLDIGLLLGRTLTGDVGATAMGPWNYRRRSPWHRILLA